MSTDFNQAIATRFLVELTRLGLSQTELANKVGVSRVTISHYKNGHYPPSAEVLSKMDALGADVRFILTGKAQVEKPISEPINLHRLGIALDEARRQQKTKDETSAIDHRDLLSQAWIIYEAWNTVLASGEPVL